MLALKIKYQQKMSYDVNLHQSRNQTFANTNNCSTSYLLSRTVFYNIAESTTEKKPHQPEASTGSFFTHGSQGGKQLSFTWRLQGAGVQQVAD